MKDYEMATQKISFESSGSSTSNYQYKMVKNDSSSSLSGMNQEITDNYSKASYSSNYSSCNYGGYSTGGVSRYF